MRDAGARGGAAAAGDEQGGACQHGHADVESRHLLVSFTLGACWCSGDGVDTAALGASGGTPTSCGTQPENWLRGSENFLKRPRSRARS